MKFKSVVKVDKTQVVCILLGITFFLGGTIVEKRSLGLLDGNKILRNSYGQGEKEQEIVVGGLLEEKTFTTVTLRERQYKEEEAEAVFDSAYELLIARILGENETLLEVRTDLNLLTWLEEYGIAVEWSSEDRELMDALGHVTNGDCPEQGMDNYLTATIKAGQYSREYVIKTKIYPPIRGEEEEKLAAYHKLIRSLDEQQRTSDSLELPREYEGQTLTYGVKNTGGYWMFLVLGTAAALLLPLREQQNQQEQRKKRERELLLDYSEVVSKLVVFLGAGLPIRKAWERIVRDYEEKLEKSGQSRHAYEEMKNTYYLMGRGVSETKAYAEFGNRCRILPYRKLAGILEQNVKNGTGNLRIILETEMHEAFEQRKLLARRLGEEAGTKLLLPLFMMLAVVMIIITVPAFLSFGI